MRAHGITSLLLVGLTVPAAAQVTPPYEGLWTVVESSTLRPTPDQGTSTFMGSEIALDAGTLVVDYFRDYRDIFVSNPGGWTFEARLQVPGATTVTGGCAIDGDTVVLGDWSDSTNGSQAGAAHVFVRAGGCWTSLARLDAAAPAADDRFGTSVAIDGDTILVGAPRHTVAGSGQVLVFNRSGGTWTQTATLDAGAPGVDDAFGYQVALEGGLAAISAPDVANQTGRLHLFRDNGGTWVEEAAVVDPNLGAGSLMGLSMSLSGNTVAAGAYGAGPSSRGAVSLFSDEGSGWGHRETLTSSEADSFRFGTSVALEGNRLLVGCTHWDEQSFNSGVAFLHEKVGGVWEAVGRLAPSDPVTGAYFGSSVALEGNTLVVGASHDDRAGQDTGSVRFFEPYTGGTVVNYCEGGWDTLGQRARVAVSGSPSLSAMDLTLTAIGARPGTFGAFFCGYEASNLPLGTGTLCVSPFTPGLFRITPQNTGSIGLVVQPITVADLPPGAPVGDRIHFQFWYRDHPSGGIGFQLSDAVQVTLGS
jgi:hypothetical protein